MQPPLVEGAEGREVGCVGGETGPLWDTISVQWLLHVFVPFFFFF